MVNKIIGYVLAALGILSILAASATVQKMLSFQLPGFLTQTTLTIIGLVLAVIGIFFLIRVGSGREVKEVPIFEGKNVVGYRRLGK